MTKIANRNTYGSEVSINELDFVLATSNATDKTKIIYLGQVKEFVIGELEKNVKDNYIILHKNTGESIPSHTPIALINNIAYKLDASNVLHQFAFVGFSINGTLAGQTCIIQQTGQLELNGWGLESNKQYLAGENGTIILNNISDTNFTKIIGYAIDSNTLKILNYSSILK